MSLRVPVGELRTGMYVEELDRPWIETPFLFQGFVIDSDDQLEELRKHCEFVYVTAAPEEAPSPAGLSLAPDPGAAPVPAARPLLHEVVHRRSVSIESELPVASGIRDQFRKTLYSLHESVRAGSSMNTAYARSVIDELTDSVLANPDAHILVTQLKGRDTYAASHSMNVSTMALAFGRHLGLNRDNLIELGLAAMLIDIGNLQLPGGLLQKKGRLSDAELKQIRTHPELGLEILHRRDQEVPPRVEEVVLCHHERVDGSGYPQGLKGEEIPLFARIVAIIDVYDASTTERIYRAGNSPSEALHVLYNSRAGLFDEELVEQFIQFLGIYPIGSVVRCTSDEVGIVIGQDPERRLRPKLLLVRDEGGVPYQQPRIIDLGLFSSEAGIDIEGILQPGEYDFDIASYIEGLSWTGKRDA